METVTITRISYREAERQLAAGVPKIRVAKRLRISKTTLWRWLRDGSLAAKAEAEDTREAV